MYSFLLYLPAPYYTTPYDNKRQMHPKHLLIFAAILIPEYRM